MKELLTAGNIALVVSVLTALYTVFKAIAEKTENRTDDKIVESLEKAREWLLSFAAPVWNTVEQLGESGAVKKSRKFDEYMGILKEVYKAAFGGEMPKATALEAGVLADGFSAADKLGKKAVQNPTPGQDVGK